MTNNNYTPPHCEPYFFGRLLRDESEKILNSRGCADGLFLLRERLQEIGNYVLSICYRNVIKHYKINRQIDSTVRIDKDANMSEKFIGPIELVRYHQIELDGLVIKPSIPCNRSQSLVEELKPIFYLFINNSEFYQLIEKEIKVMCRTLDEKKDARGRLRYKFEEIIVKRIHMTQKWYYKGMDRKTSTRMIRDSGFKNGKFLVRYNSGFYKISLCYENEVKHYKVLFENNKYSIEGSAEKFDSIIQLVDYYHRIAQGMVYRLLIPFIDQRYIDGEIVNSEVYYESNQMYNTLVNSCDANIVIQGVLAIPANNEEDPYADVTNLDNLPESMREILQDTNSYNYENIPQNYKIDINDIISEDSYLGKGAFGEVKRGLYKTFRNGKDVKLPVAIKTTLVETEADKEEFLKEAHIMFSLKHDHLIKLIGVTLDSNSKYNIVLELAQLGTLQSFLKDHHNFAMNKIIKLMHQIALGMMYLSSQKVVHRDLAARNVLLVNENLAKVSDFGMSKKMNEYYYIQQSEKGRFPMKWYSLEAITDNKFSEKSDGIFLRLSNS